MPYDESKRRVFARPLTHPDVAHLEAIIEDNRRNMRSIDRVLFTKPYKVERKHRDVESAHDIATRNPLLRKLLRELQK